MSEVSMQRKKICSTVGYQVRITSFTLYMTNTYIINNCISSLHSGLTIKELCMAGDGGNLKNVDILTV